MIGRQHHDVIEPSPSGAVEARMSSGRRGAMRSLGAAALALVAGQGFMRTSAAKKAKAEAKGKRGKPGPPGPQGAPGVGTITLVEDNQTVQPGQWNEGFAQCPAGQRVISGGGYLNNDQCVLTGSQKAVVLPETWFAGGRCPVGQTSNIRVTAMCIAS